MAFPKGHKVDHTAFKCFACGREALRGRLIQIGAGAFKMAIVKTCRNRECLLDAEFGKSVLIPRSRSAKGKK